MTRLRIVLGLIVGLVGTAGALALGANSCVDCHQRAETFTALRDSRSPIYYKNIPEPAGLAMKRSITSLSKATITRI